MAYFYSEKGARFFILLLTFLFCWLFAGLSRAALTCRTRLPEEAGSLARKLYVEQSQEVSAENAVFLLRAANIKNK
ncbi:MAG: hypothetical protein GX946_09475 [Oligosphaeraceae bacterium]|nr:hypothetical protein [Oligosphaeraceae bacterium]